MTKFYSIKQLARQLEDVAPEILESVVAIYITQLQLEARAAEEQQQVSGSARVEHIGFDSFALEQRYECSGE